MLYLIFSYQNHKKSEFSNDCWKDFTDIYTVQMNGTQIADSWKMMDYLREKISVQMSSYN